MVPVTPRVAELRQRVDLSLIAAPVHPDTTQSNRAPLPATPVLRYDVTVRNPSGLPLGAKLALAPLPDSAVVFVADSAVMRYAQLGDAAIPVPDRPGQDVRVLAWAAGAGRVGDSATATLQLGPTALAVRAVIHNPLRPAAKSTWVATTLARVPAADSMVPGAELELALEPTPAGWPDVGYGLSAGWRLVAGSVQLGHAPAPDPVTTQDGAGRWLRWHFAGAATAPITLRLTAGRAAAADTSHVTVPAARTAAAREEERNGALLRGPGIEIFSPVDGTVLPGDHVYIGVKGEANAPVQLYDGATLLNSVQMRVDGVYDFIAVPLARGPHHLRVAMKNSWGAERWDSIAVHVTGVRGPACLRDCAGAGRRARGARCRRFVGGHAVPLLHVGRADGRSAPGPRGRSRRARAQVGRTHGHRAATAAARSSRADGCGLGPGGCRGEPRRLRGDHGARPHRLAHLAHARRGLPPPQ